MDAAVVLQARWQSETPDQKKKKSATRCQYHRRQLSSHTTVLYTLNCDQYLAMNFMVVKTITNQVHLET